MGAKRLDSPTLPIETVQTMVRHLLSALALTLLTGVATLTATPASANERIGVLMLQPGPQLQPDEDRL